ncbi:MAG TPA: alpha-ribazole phosphatase [Patescibacteria group bacterium]|nr:alpha-ribazole phosphatase [Patescibacteria group bacterium]
MNIYIVRHTAPELDAGICYGQSDVPVDKAIYKECLETLKTKLQGINFDACYSSQLTRCKVLAADLFGGDLVEDKRLMELNFGQWEMKRWNEIDSKLLKDWGDQFDTVPCPDGESFEILQRRVIDFWQELTRKDHNTVMISTHGGVIRALVAHIFKMPLSNAFSIKLDYAGITKISYDPKLTCVSFLNA